MTSETTTSATTAYMVGAEGGRYIDELNLRILADGKQTHEQMLAMVATNPVPGGPPLHTHHSHDELYYVLEGRYRFRIGEQELEGGPGSFVYVPRGTTQTFANIGPGTGRIFSMTLPGFDGFVERMAELPLQGGKRVGAEDLFRDFDSDLNGPPLL